MAKLIDKVRDLSTFAWNSLRHAIILAEKTGSYKDFEAAMKRVHMTEVLLKSVRAHVRANMRKTKQAFQDACPHTNKVDVNVREGYLDGGKEWRRTVEVQACTVCSKSFDLREKVQ